MSVMTVDAIGPAACEQCGAREDFGETHDTRCRVGRKPRDRAWRVETTAGDVWVWLELTPRDCGPTEWFAVEMEGACRTSCPSHFCESNDLSVIARVVRYVLLQLHDAKLVAIHAPRGDR